MAGPEVRRDDQMEVLAIAIIVLTNTFTSVGRGIGIAADELVAFVIREQGAWRQFRWQAWSQTSRHPPHR